MKSKLMVAVMSASLLLAGACGPPPDVSLIPESTPNIPGTGNDPIPTTSETQSMVVASPGGTRAPVETAALPSPSAVAFDPETKLMVNYENDVPFLTDERGRSLYVYFNDKQNNGASACIDDCAVEWPPLTVRGKPAADEGVDPSLLGTLKRDDGTLQATYNGWPLYYYGMDTIPGSMFGQSYNGVWFLISPSGEPIQR
jgi:predicted lipoprotein with Yx(FWY)xxD motif